MKEAHAITQTRQDLVNDAHVQHQLQAPALFNLWQDPALGGSPRALEKIGVSRGQEQQGLLDARGAAHRRELAAMQLYQSRLEQQIQALRKDREHMMALNHELSRSAEAAGVVQSQQIAQLQRMADLERDAAASERHDIDSGMERAEMQAMKREITRLELEVEQDKMHVKELLFSQKLERLQHAQMVEQKRRETDAKEEALKEIRDLKHELQVERVQISALTAGLMHAETTVESFKGRNIDKRHEVIEDLTRQLNNLKALTDDLWARLHEANKKLAHSSEAHEKQEHQLSFTIDQLRTTVATLTEEQEHMWDQASQVALRAMSQHHRELLHNLEVETFKARSALAAAPANPAAALPRGAGGGEGSPCHTPVFQVLGGLDDGGTVALQHRLEALQNTFQRFDLVEQRALGMEV